MRTTVGSPPDKLPATCQRGSPLHSAFCDPALFESLIRGAFPSHTLTLRRTISARTARKTNALCRELGKDSPSLFQHRSLWAASLRALTQTLESSIATGLTPGGIAFAKNIAECVKQTLAEIEPRRSNPTCSVQQDAATHRKSLADQVKQSLGPVGHSERGFTALQSARCLLNTFLGNVVAHQCAVVDSQAENEAFGGLDFTIGGFLDVWSQIRTMYNKLCSTCARRGSQFFDQRGCSDCEPDSMIVLHSWIYLSLISKCHHLIDKLFNCDYAAGGLDVAFEVAELRTLFRLTSGYDVFRESLVHRLQVLPSCKARNPGYLLSLFLDISQVTFMLQWDSKYGSVEELLKPLAGMIVDSPISSRSFLTNFKDLTHRSKRLREISRLSHKFDKPCAAYEKVAQCGLGRNTQRLSSAGLVELVRSSSAMDCHPCSLHTEPEDKMQPKRPQRLQDLLNKLTNRVILVPQQESPHIIASTNESTTSVDADEIDSIAVLDLYMTMHSARSGFFANFAESVASQLMDQVATPNATELARFVEDCKELFQLIMRRKELIPAGDRERFDCCEQLLKDADESIAWQANFKQSTADQILKHSQVFVIAKCSWPASKQSTKPTVVATADLPVVESEDDEDDGVNIWTRNDRTEVGMVAAKLVAEFEKRQPSRTLQWLADISRVDLCIKLGTIESCVSVNIPEAQVICALCQLLREKSSGWLRQKPAVTGNDIAKLLQVPPGLVKSVCYSLHASGHITWNKNEDPVISKLSLSKAPHDKRDAAAPSTFSVVGAKGQKSGIEDENKANLPNNEGHRVCSTTGVGGVRKRIIDVLTSRESFHRVPSGLPPYFLYPRVKRALPDLSWKEFNSALFGLVAEGKIINKGGQYFLWAATRPTVPP